MFYSKSTGGFYNPSIHGNIPADAVEITAEDYWRLTNEVPAGKMIGADENGYPVFIDPPRPVCTKASLLAGVADKRWQIETGGIIVSGCPIKTDRESQALLSSTYNSLAAGFIPNTPWKTADGSFMLATLADIEPVAQAVAVFVRACFASEEAHCQAIATLQTQDELDSYDIDAGWPV